MAKKSKISLSLRKSSLVNIVNDYTKNHLGNFNGYLHSASINAHWWVYGYSIKHPHQYRVADATLRAVENALNTAMMPTFKDFEDLFDWVDKTIKGSKPLMQNTGLLTYDIALRIGYGLSPQVLPQKYVYILAQGPRDGLKDYCTNLGIAAPRKMKGYLVDATFFNKMIRTFTPAYNLSNSMYLEDILCIY